MSIQLRRHRRRHLDQRGPFTRTVKVILPGETVGAECQKWDFRMITATSTRMRTFLPRGSHNPSGKARPQGRSTAQTQKKIQPYQSFHVRKWFLTQAASAVQETTSPQADMRHLQCVCHDLWNTPTQPQDTRRFRFLRRYHPSARTARSSGGKSAGSRYGYYGVLFGT